MRSRVRAIKKLDKLLGAANQIPGDFIISNEDLCHHKNVNYLSDIIFLLCMQILPLVLREVSQYKIHNAGFQGLDNDKYLKE